jgi:hypothetical protein
MYLHTIRLEYVSSAEGTAWTTFILSLFLRNPENVTIIKDHIRDLWEHSKAALEANYAGLPTYPETFDGYMALTNPAAAEIAASNLLMKTIANERLGQPIFGMHWTRHDLKNSKFQLLTSDRPFIMPLGLGDPRAYIALPVSPTVLFVAAHDPAFARSLAGLKQTELVWVLNKEVVSQARKFVWATDDSQLEFVRRHIGTAPDRTIITEAQKQEALAAAPPAVAPLCPTAQEAQNVEDTISTRLPSKRSRDRRGRRGRVPLQARIIGRRAPRTLSFRKMTDSVWRASHRLERRSAAPCP